MVSSETAVKIYPSDRGHFALGSPHGDLLLPGDPLTVLLAGYNITGVIQTSGQGDYLLLPDGGYCGLCARMQVFILPNETPLTEQIRAAYYDNSPASELQLERLTRKAMRTMSDAEWYALCAIGQKPQLKVSFTKCSGDLAS